MGRKERRRALTLTYPYPRVYLKRILDATAPPLRMPDEAGEGVHPYVAIQLAEVGDLARMDWMDYWEGAAYRRSGRGPGS